MSQFACKLLTNNVIRYVGFCDTIDQFISPAFASPECVAKALGGVTAEECRETAERHVYDMRHEVIHEATKLLSDLKLGKTLKVAEMSLLSGVLNFLEATVAPHQWDYSEISVEVVGAWISELGLRRKYPDYDDYDILMDCAVYPAIQEAPQRRHIPHAFHGPRKRPLVSQNKLAGRYVSKLALIANIVGPEKNTPEEIVAKFYEKLKGQTRI